MIRTVAVPKRRDPKSTRDRVEFRADPAWIARVLKAAARLGMGLSAYIRYSTNKQMERDAADSAKADHSPD